MKGQKQPGSTSKCTSLTPLPISVWVSLEAWSCRGTEDYCEIFSCSQITSKLTKLFYSVQHSSWSWVWVSCRPHRGGGKEEDGRGSFSTLAWRHRPHCKLAIIAQSFRMSKSLCGFCISYLIFNKSLGFGTNYLLGRQITLISSIANFR